MSEDTEIRIIIITVSLVVVVVFSNKNSINNPYIAYSGLRRPMFVCNPTLLIVTTVVIIV